MTEASPWTHLIPWPHGREGPVRLDLTADATTRKAVARYLNLEDLALLAARLSVQPWRDGAEISGEIRAVLTRLCGLTLEPFEALLDEPVFIRALPAGSPHAPPPPSHDVDLENEAEEPPEVLGAAGVDLGDLVVQTLALALDPFPRKPGAVFNAPDVRAEASPFDILARLTAPKD